GRRGLSALELAWLSGAAFQRGDSNAGTACIGQYPLHMAATA
ncbi:hypothetical protein Pgy4_39705, partial [Pseudomonas savastanoi pv. glycinea str. race 4]